ncbi:hypothetical protein ACLOJK_010354 [Asimina triloba]
MEIFNSFDSTEAQLPPGYRFHPTDEELTTYYLMKKVLDSSFTGRAIAELANPCNATINAEKAKMGEKEWYFFSLRDRKYPTGLRTNRATEAGYWKATGKDREIYSSRMGALVGMKKTLVFYKGRAPKGEKSNWVMHEYRLDGKLSYHYLSRSSKVCIAAIMSMEPHHGDLGGPCASHDRLSKISIKCLTPCIGGAGNPLRSDRYAFRFATKYSCSPPNPDLPYHMTSISPAKSLVSTLDRVGPSAIGPLQTDSFKT